MRRPPRATSFVFPLFLQVLLFDLESEIGGAEARAVTKVPLTVQSREVDLLNSNLGGENWLQLEDRKEQGEEGHYEDHDEERMHSSPFLAFLYTDWGLHVCVYLYRYPVDASSSLKPAPTGFVCLTA